MSHSMYDPYRRNRPSASSLNPHGEPARTFSAAQLRQIETAFQEMEQRAQQWEAKARELEAALSAVQIQASDLEAQAYQVEIAANEARGQLATAEAETSRWESEAIATEEQAKKSEIALQAADEKVTELQDQNLRLQADFQNTRRRLENRFAAQADQEVMSFAQDLLPVVDNLDRALANAPDSDDGVEQMRQGVELTRQAFLSALAKHDISEISAAGEIFDPELHEALGVVPAPEVPPGTVVRVEQNGYTYGDKLLRPARVLISPLT